MGYIECNMDYDQDMELKNPKQTDDEEEEIEERWDGSEAELVADDDAAVYEDPQTGIRFNYVLRHSEIYQCLKNTGYIKTTGSRAIIETVLLVLAAGVFFTTWFLQHTVDSLIFAVICLLLIAVVWVVPELGLRRQSRKLASGEELAMEIYPDSVVMTHGEEEMEFPLDGESTSIAQYETIIVLFHKGKMAILPLRSVEPGVLPEVQAMLLAGTTPQE